MEEGFDGPKATDMLIVWLMEMRPCSGPVPSVLAVAEQVKDEAFADLLTRSM